MSERDVRNLVGTTVRLQRELVGQRHDLPTGRRLRREQRRLSSELYADGSSARAAVGRLRSRPNGTCVPWPNVRLVSADFGTKVSWSASNGLRFDARVFP